MTAYRLLLVAALSLTVVVVGLGAYVRLSDAGLGCPDWPGCYGHYVGVPSAAHEQAAAAQAFPGQPVETAKAWKEMIHRYAAAALGLLILAVVGRAWVLGRAGGAAPGAATALLPLLALQAALGMWTVTRLLKPVIVTAHLLGGMATLALLAALLTAAWPLSTVEAAPRLRWAGRLALVVVFAQIALGGWVSSNYAALACGDFPTCQGAWLPPMEFGEALHWRRELGQTTTGEWLPFAALTAIHWLHRVGAVVTAVVVGGLAIVLFRSPPWRRWGIALAAALLTQIGLGIANVLLALPLSLAVAHNLGAAALLALLATLNVRLSRASVGQAVSRVAGSAV